LLRPEDKKNNGAYISTFGVPNLTTVNYGGNSCPPVSNMVLFPKTNRLNVVGI
jgi:hypothetical protein